MLISVGLLSDQRPRFVGGEVPTEELGHQSQPHRELVGLAVVHGEDAVLVTGEVGELPHVVPYPLVRGVEEVGTVLVHLDAGLRLSLGVRVPADMRAPVDDEHPLSELRSHALGDRQTEEAGADDIEVKATGRRSHRLPRVSDCETAARFAAALRRGLINSRPLGSPNTGVADNDWAIFGDESRDLFTIRSRHSSNNIHVSNIGQVPE